MSALQDIDIEEIEKFATGLMGSGFMVSEKNGGSRPLAKNEAKLLAHAAKHYRLDPIMGEVSLLGTKLYTGLLGVRKAARESARAMGIRYQERARPATAEECKVSMLGDKEHYWIAEVTLEHETGTQTFIGHGYASPENVAIAAMWRNGQLQGFDPRVLRNMAENRATRRALVAAFGLPFGDPEDAGREEEPKLPAKAVTAPETGSPQVYPAIPAKPESAPTVVMDTAPKPEAEKVQRQQTAATSYPPKPGADAKRHEVNGVPVRRAPAKKSPEAPPAKSQPPESAEEMRAILEREAAEEKAEADARRGHVDDWPEGKE